MNVLLNPRFLAALAGLVGVVVAVAHPGTDEGKVVGFVSSLLSFLAGYFQPAPGQPTATDVGQGGPAAKQPPAR